MYKLAVRQVDFHGATITAAQDKESGKIYVGVRWVCDGLGLTTGQMQKERLTIKEDIVLCKGERNLVLPTKGGNQEVLCIELDFLPLWLAKISITPNMQKEQPELTERLVKYQLEAKDVLAAAFINKKSSNHRPRKRPTDVVFRQNVNIANTLVQNTGVKPGIALAAAIERTEMITGEDLTIYKQLLPAADHDTGYLNATRIGKQIGESNQKVNQTLLQSGYQYKDDDGNWRLTDLGKQYGEELPFTRNGHSGYQIRWSEKIVSTLRTAIVASA